MEVQTLNGDFLADQAFLVQERFLDFARQTTESRILQERSIRVASNGGQETCQWLRDGLAAGSFAHPKSTIEEGRFSYHDPERAAKQYRLFVGDHLITGDDMEKPLSYFLIDREPFFAVAPVEFLIILESGEKVKVSEFKLNTVFTATKRFMSI